MAEYLDELVKAVDEFFENDFPEVSEFVLIGPKQTMVELGERINRRHFLGYTQSTIISRVHDSRLVRDEYQLKVGFDKDY